MPGYLDNQDTYRALAWRTNVHAIPDLRRFCPLTILKSIV
jgi:hypothetical protein